ncbi:MULTISPECIES: galactose oxidase-like domain-containing protein [Limnobacter]|uniref:Galactose oxidase-like Early set domain-containing protein n=1 Tax=Limnobacter litoralis TaxID=481366 RepID=A0ABQ5YUQ4_9BURK|nr:MULTISPECIES: galactose oxidase-like domain-containing protein [Limnobacter]GLR27150.1 hypothetical protein GCM10007875_22410 [Limnobacter litoralis]HEX5485569.1 galactose oxidase-like domain-containing protein [Limnobacter sp.]
MFKLNRLATAIAFTITASTAAHAAGLLDDLIGAKYVPTNPQQTCKDASCLGSFSEPFAEPYVYYRTKDSKGNAIAVDPVATDQKCLADPAHGRMKCKPAAGTISLLPDGDFLYFNALEGTEDFQLGILTDFGQKAINDQTRLMHIPRDANSATSWLLPYPIDAGANPNGYNSTELVPGLSSNKQTNSADGALFCADVTMLADGRIMAVGGTSYYSEPGINNVPYGLVELEGLRNARAYNQNTNEWTQLADMNYGRWYPSTVNLADSKIFVASGVTKLLKPVYPQAPEQSGRNVVQTETFDMNGGTDGKGIWKVNGPAAQRALPLFPRLHLLPDGEVYYNAGGQAFNPFGQSYDQPLWNITGAYNPGTDSWTDIAYAGFPMKFDDAGLGSLTQALNVATGGSATTAALAKVLTQAPIKSPQALLKTLSTLGGNPQAALQQVVGAGMRGSTFSIMLPLRPNANGQYTDASFLTAGGVLPLVVAGSPGGYVAVAGSRIDTVKTQPAAKQADAKVVGYSSEVTGALNQTRWYGSGVLLPDDSVMVFSGADRDGVAAPGVEYPRKTAERFDPKTKTWTEMAVAHHPRTYHNTALLMPDGRVLVGGHAPISTLYLKDINLAAFGFAPNDGRDPSFEIYTPPYVTNPARPVLTGFTDAPAPNPVTGQATLKAAHRGDELTVQMGGNTMASDIDSVIIVRHTVTTHLVDGDQRTVVVPKSAFTKVAGKNLSFKVPSQAAVLPAGAYMVFVRTKDSKGNLLPSKSVSFMIQNAS